VMVAAAARTRWTWKHPRITENRNTRLKNLPKCTSSARPAHDVVGACNACGGSAAGVVVDAAEHKDSSVEISEDGGGDGDTPDTPDSFSAGQAALVLCGLPTPSPCTNVTRLVGAIIQPSSINNDDPWSPCVIPNAFLRSC
jgi:hypothetical protein